MYKHTYIMYSNYLFEEQKIFFFNVVMAPQNPAPSLCVCTYCFIWELFFPTLFSFIN